MLKSVLGAVRTPLHRDDRGVAIVEFALIAPILILFYVATAQLCQGLMAERRTNHSAFAIADLVSRASEVDAEEIQAIFDIAEIILSPFPTADLKLRVTSVKVNAQGSPRVVWSDSHNWSDLPTDSVVDVPQVMGANGEEDFLKPGESAIMAETTYTFVTPFDAFFVNAMQLLGSSPEAGGWEFEEREFLRPRRSSEIKYKV